MSANAEARQSALDSVLDGRTPTAADGEALFAVVDSLAASPALRRALTDAGTPEPARVEVVNALFADRVSATALAVLTGAVRLSWATTGSFVGAIEREGVRAILSQADRGGALSTVEDELFQVGRVVDASPDLRVALGERQTALAGRQTLLDEVLGAKVRPETRILALRAVAARERTFDHTITSYLTTAADLRNRSIANVEVAQALTDAQATRLRAALAAKAGRDITLNVVVNPAVLGGVRVALGDEVIEGTVADRLADVRRQLS